MKKTLYRAANADDILPPIAFGARRSVAEAYTNNGGFGGANLYKTVVDIDRDKVLDIFGMTKDQATRAVMEVSGLDDPGAIGADEWVMYPHVAVALIHAGVQWVRLTDSFPQGAETWVFLGSPEADDPELERIL